MKRFQLCIYFMVCIVAVLGSKKNYYWLDYEGKIPENAVRAGQGTDGNTIYIGKTNKYVLEIPGYIDSSTKELYFLKDRTIPQTVDTQIKILCADHPEQMEWVTINNENFRFILYLNIVMGGSYIAKQYGEYPWLIGRHIFNNGIIVGGVSTHEYEMHLYANNGLDEQTIPMEIGFQLLSFNPYLPIRGQCGSRKVSDEGYYWRNYYGSIPKNAVPGGTNPDGTVTYIGQINYNNTVTPGNFDPINKLLYFVDHGKPVKDSVNVQILCANNLNQMEWVDVSTANYWFQWEKHIVLGGHVGKYPYIVGRKRYEDRVVVGAAVTYGYSAILNLVYDGKAKAVDTFQILTYIPYEEHCPNYTNY